MAGSAGWQSKDDGRESMLGLAGMGVLRFTLLFGSAAIALALIIAPIAESQTRKFVGAPGVDTMATGSVNSNTNNYTVRRSVLQDSPNAICVIRQNGTRSGNC